MLIAESGATKTEWRLIRDGKEVLAFRTAGFNPNVMSEKLISQEMSDIFRKFLKEETIDEIYFYGAGLRLKSQRDVIQKILINLQPAAYLSVNHDLSAAARSTGFIEGIVGILGTGSNTCYYKNGEVLEQRGGHGYIFGDEGSGADLGRHLVKGLLEGSFPEAVKNFIESQEGVNLEELKLAIYRAEKPNVRMARLSKYLDEILHHDSVKRMIEARFDAFLVNSVLAYPNYQSLPVTFVGSIAYYFQEILLERCRQNGIEKVDIQHDPIENLVSYHISHQRSQMA
ncbi:MAG: hypothetical protein MRZ79_21010 [Bacteroidia bacterium]|nr:hypothetical protein [Bacteroidia bacterium]